MDIFKKIEEDYVLSVLRDKKPVDAGIWHAWDFIGYIERMGNLLVVDLTKDSDAILVYKSLLKMNKLKIIVERNNLYSTQ